MIERLKKLTEFFLTYLNFVFIYIGKYIISNQIY